MILPRDEWTIAWCRKNKGKKVKIVSDSVYRRGDRFIGEVGIVAGVDGYGDRRFVAVNFVGELKRWFFDTDDLMIIDAIEPDYLPE